MNNNICSDATKLATVFELHGNLVSKGTHVYAPSSMLDILQKEMFPALQNHVLTQVPQALAEIIVIINKYGNEIMKKNVSRVLACLGKELIVQARALFAAQNRIDWQILVRDTLEAAEACDSSLFTSSEVVRPEDATMLRAWKTGTLAPLKPISTKVVSFLEDCKTEESFTMHAQKTVEKLFVTACRNSNLVVAQMLFETKQVRLSVTGQEAVRLWNADVAAVTKNRTDAWKSMMRWLLTLVMKHDLKQLAECCEEGWDEMMTAWAKGEFN